MATIEQIVEKEQTYKEQMLPIREVVLRFAESKGWSLMSRGRRAHVSIYGPVNGLNGVIDIIMVGDDWDKMPSSLQPDTAFTLWAAASLDRDGVRLCADTVLFWTAPFAILPETTEVFLPQAWVMLAQLSHSNLVKEWPGPFEHPDGPPHFGPPQKTGNRT
jgi:hypothetical protein